MKSLNDIGNPDAPVGSRDWVVAYNLETQTKLWDARTKVGDFRRSLRQFEQKAYYKLLEDRKDQKFDTFEAFCAEAPPFGLGLKPEQAHAIAGEPDDQRAVVELIAANTMAKAEPLANQGRPKKGEDKGYHDNLLRGTSPYYLAARIKRDHPEIAEAVERGEFKSMRQAGVAAGFVKTRKTLTIGEPAKVAARLMKEGEEYAVQVADEVMKAVRLNRFSSQSGG